MSPSDFAKTVSQQLPIISKDFYKFTEIFEILMYKDLTISERNDLVIHLEQQYKLIKRT